jgi:DinB family protein
MANPDPLRKQLVELLRMEGAHLSFDDAVADFPVKLRGIKPRGAPHTPWQLLEHLRIAQWDILDFSRNPAYQEMKWPDDYWPKTEAPPDAAAWDKSIEQFRRDLKAIEELVSDAGTDLTARIPHGTGQTLLREVLLVADHNSYHIGQLVFVRKMLEAK